MTSSFTGDSLYSHASSSGDFHSSAVVVLRGESDVASARLLEDLRPLDGVEELRFEEGGELVVAECRPEDAIVEVDGELMPLFLARIVSRRGPERVPVPLRVLLGSGERGHRVHAPMDEDPELRVEVPLRRRPRVERGPI